MNTAASKEVKVNLFTQDCLTRPGENVLCAVIIGPDFDDPGVKTLHLRGYAAAIELLQTLEPETREMIAQHLDRLLGEFRKMVAG